MKIKVFEAFSGIGNTLNGKGFIIYDYYLLTTSNLSDCYVATDFNDLWGV